MRLTLRAVTTDPSWVTLTRSVNGVAGPIVGTGTNSCTVFPKSATGTHCEQVTGQYLIIASHLTKP